MHYTIDSNPTRGLRVITEIPDIPLCRIEGHNGVGKTVALRLLQLCTGAQPYERQPRAWRTLRDQLGPTRVTVRQLREASVIEWYLDPADWPPSPEPLGDRLGRVRIDGRPARVIDTVPLLRVYRIAGDEDFLRTLTTQVQTAESLLSGWISERGSGGRRRTLLDQRLRDAATLLTAPKPEALRDARLALADADHEADELARQHHAARQRLSVLDQAVTLSEQLDELRGRGPGLDEQLAAIAPQQTELIARREDLDTRIRETADRQLASERASARFHRAEQTLARRQRELQQTLADLHQAATIAGVDLDRAMLDQARDTLGAQLAELTALLPQVHAAPLIVDLLTDVAARLRSAEEAGLADQQLLPAESGARSWTVRRLRETCQQQAAIRSAETPGKAAEQLEAKITALRARLAALESMARLWAAADVAAAAMATAKERVDAALAELPTEISTTVEQLLQDRTRLDEQLRDLDIQHQRIQLARSLLGEGRSERSLTEELDAVCNEADVHPSRVRAAHATAQARLAETETATATATAHAETRRQTLAANVDQITAAFTAIFARDDLRWLRASIAGDETDAERQAQALAALVRRLETARGRLDEINHNVFAIAGALAELAAALAVADEHALDAGKPWAEATRRWLSRNVSRWFDQPEIRGALFPDATDLRVDMTLMEVTWSASGKTFSRPLTAFSSGEQALAYTRARLAALDSVDTDVANRLIALDEFGAFLEDDRMARLAMYLSTRRADQPHDQIVVVLPLRAPADEDSRRLLETRGYVAGTLNS